MALIFATVFSLFVASVLSFTEVGLRASGSYAARARSSYAADGAVNAAINRYGLSEPCEDYTAPEGPGGPVNGEGMVVHCSAGKRASTPVNALLSLGTVPGENGIDSIGDLRVLGDIVSNSTVHAGGTMVVQGEVSALGNCSPLANIQTAPAVPLHCANATPPSPADPGQARDPDYTAALSTVPARRSVPPCPAAEPRIVPLDPGYYDDDALAGLQALTAPGACLNLAIWFRPGAYYLDFTFLRGATTAAAGTWAINEPTARVVGGTPAGWDPVAGTLPSSVPGSCQAAGPGVQIIMGGQSTRVEVDAGRVEFCAEPSTTEQQIALYGIRAEVRNHVLTPTATSGPTAFTGTTSAMTIGEQPPPPLVGPLSAVAVIGGGTPSASLTLTGFRPRVPIGAVIDSAVLRVAHQDDAGVDSVTVSTAGESCAAHVLTPNPAFTVDTIDLKACGLTAAANYQENLSVTYTAQSASPAAVSDHLDGVAIDVSYRPPETRKPTVASAVTTFTTPDRALEIGERDAAGDPLTASATLGGATNSASVTLVGMGDPPIPTASTIDSAVLRVAHRDQGDIVATGPTITVGTCTDQPLPLYPAAIGEDRVDLKTACGVTGSSSLTGLTATYKVAGGGAVATDDLDGVWLEIVYSPPFTTGEATTATPAGFTNAANATTLDGTTADAALSTGAPTASLTMTGYTSPAGDPGLDTAIARVRHREDGNAGPVTVTAAWTGGGGGSCFGTFTPHPGGLVDDQLDLKACGLGDRSLAGLSVTYTSALAGSGGGATSHVDAIVLDVAYAPPATHAPSATSAVYGFVNPTNALAVDGTTSDAAPGASAASVVLGGFDQVKIPPGSAIDSAALRVIHQDDGPIGPVGLAATFSGALLPCGNAALPFHAGAPGADTVDLAGCGLKDAGQLSSLAATYSAAATADTTRPATNVVASTFANGDNARTIDGTSAEAALDTTTTSPASASITLDGYDVTLPAGATLDSAMLKVDHRDDSPVGPVTVTVSWTGGTGGSCTRTLASRPTALAEDLISLKDCGLADLADLTGLSVNYTADLTTAGATASDFLDGIALVFVADRLDGVLLDIVFRPPTLRPLSGCLIKSPYTNADPSTCALVKVAPLPGDTFTRFVSVGTIYAPSAALDISMAGLNTQVLTRGLIARAIRLGLAAAPGYRRPTGGVPPEAVVFTAYPSANVRSDLAAANVAPGDFTDAGNATAIGETPSPLTADAAIDPTTFTHNASMTLDDFDDPTLPGITVIDGASLRVAHSDATGMLSVTVAVTFPGHTCTVDLPIHDALLEDQVDLTVCGLTSASQLADLNVTYTATADPAAASPVVAKLDGIVAVVRFGPMVRATVTFDRGKATVQGWSVLR